MLHVRAQIAILWSKLGTAASDGLTDGLDKVGEGSVGEERLGELPEEHLEGPGGDVDVLPLGVIQIHLLVYEGWRWEQECPSMTLFNSAVRCQYLVSDTFIP